MEADRLRATLQAEPPVVGTANRSPPGETGWGEPRTGVGGGRNARWMSQAQEHQVQTIEDEIVVKEAGGDVGVVGVVGRGHFVGYSPMLDPRPLQKRPLGA